MSKVKNELEELSFRALEPVAYETLKAKVEAKRRVTEGVIEELQADDHAEAGRGAGAGAARSTAASSASTASSSS